MLTWYYALLHLVSMHGTGMTKCQFSSPQGSQPIFQVVKGCSTSDASLEPENGESLGVRAYRNIYFTQ